MTTEHPTPWRVEDDSSVIMDAEGNYIAEGYDRETAERIVRAANGHGPLLAACKRIVRAADLSLADGDEYQRFAEISRAEIDAVRAAVAEYEGGPTP